MNRVKKVIVIFLCVSIMVSLFTQYAIAKSSMLTNGIYLADNGTMNSYKDVLINEKNGSRYAGRIWTDKSVLTKDLILDMETDGYNGRINLNADFLNVFSTLGSSQALKFFSPTKTVIVIDNSASMYSNDKTDWTKTRMDKTINAVNESIDSLMRAGELNEVAIVLLGNGAKNGEKEADANTAKVIVPMGHYEVSNDPERPYQYVDGGWKYKDASDQNMANSPIKDPQQANFSAGYVYVDKRYINETFKVDENIKLTDTGEKRYDKYSNGTTNINAGIYVGFKTLMEEEPTVKVSGNIFKYLPSVVLLSDGAATDMLEGSWANPTLTDYGFTNDRGNKKASYIKAFEDPQGKYTWDWDMYIDLINSDGQLRLEQIGYGDGTLIKDGLDSDPRPNALGEQNLKKFADEVRSTHAAIMLRTILNSSYMKEQVEHKYQTACKFYTISLDITNPEEIKLPSQGEWFSGTASYNISTSPVIMNPNNYFNVAWLKEKGYIKQNADINNLKDDDIVYEPYTVGYELILAMIDAIKAYEEFHNNSSSFVERNKINTYVVYDEAKGLWSDMKDYKATVDDTEYDATYPIGHGHSNAYYIHDRKSVTIDNLNPNDKVNNPYGISNKDIDYNYVNGSYYVSSKEDSSDMISDTFEKIVGDIVSSAFDPIGGVNDDGVADSLTYNDPIGKYMEVKDNAVTIDGKTYDMALLLFGELHGIVKTGIYDYNFNKTHRGPTHKSSDLKESFTMGWYDKDGNYLGNNGSWDSGDTYYLDNDTIKQYVPTIDESGNMDAEQLSKTYVVYRFNEDATERNKDRKNISYGESGNVIYKLSDIRIWVERDKSKKEYNNILYANIPATAMPLQVAYVQFSNSDKVESYTTNLDNKPASTPLRLFYGVGLDDELLINNNEDIDLTKISEDYIKEHTSEDGYLEFYSNYYSNTPYDGYTADIYDAARTRGDATTTFSPSETNRYYVYQKNLKLYKHAYLIGDNGEIIKEDSPKLFEGADFDGELPGKTEGNLPDEEAQKAIKEASNKGELKPGDIITLKDDAIKYGEKPSSDDYYYFVIDYIIPTSDGKGETELYVVSRKGSEFGSGILQDQGDKIPIGDFLSWIDISETSSNIYNYSDVIPEDELIKGEWVLATKIGGLRVGDLHQSVSVKDENISGTSRNYYLPIIADDLSTEGYDAILNTYLGNNGLIKYNIGKYNLPVTGGVGTILYIVIGITLIGIPIFIIYRKKYKTKYHATTILK